MHIADQIEYVKTMIKNVSDEIGFSQDREEISHLADEKVRLISLLVSLEKLAKINSLVEAFNAQKVTPTSL